MMTWLRPLRLLVGLMLAACVPVTVNITFPQEKLEGAATRIEDMVRSPENPPPEPAPKKSPGSRLDQLLAALAPRQAAAQGKSLEVAPEIKTQTPELMQHIASRRGRFKEVRELKTRGCVGETNQGLLEPRPAQDCFADVAKLVAAENADRQYIYDTMIQQSNIPAGDAPRVRAAFAKVRRERARPGDWVQMENGQWAKK